MHNALDSGMFLGKTALPMASSDNVRQLHRERLPQQLIIGPNFLNLALVHFEEIENVWLVPDATQPLPQVAIFHRQALHGRMTA